MFRKLILCGWIGATLAATAVAPPLRAQEAPRPAPPAGPPSAPASPAERPGDEVKENPKRILGIIPNFQTTNQSPFAQKPLTTREKYNLAWHQMFDFSAHLGNAFQAGIQHATDAEPHYGQGWGAYAERFGAAEADQVTSSFFIFGFFPHLLKQDPRYFRKGRGPVFSRMVYSASRTFIARTDSGHPTFNASQVFGQMAQAGIANLYYPREDRDLDGTAKGWAMGLAYTSLYNLVKEFYPDTVGRLFERRRKTPPPGPAARAVPAKPAP